jgi:hypothetical protein
MGILGNLLRPHLEALTKAYKANETKLLSEYETKKNGENDSEQKHQRLNNESENFRQQGNQFFQALDYNQAQHMYTKSIAAAREGPLAALAYFNRFDPINNKPNYLLISIVYNYKKKSIFAGLQHCFT